MAQRVVEREVAAHRVRHDAAADDPERTLDRLEKAFRRFKAKAPKHPAPPDVDLPAIGRDAHLPMAREQVHVFLGHLGIRRTHPDFYVLSVMDHVLGTGPGFTSRCSRKLRDEQGLCYSVSAGITASAGEEPGTFTSCSSCAPTGSCRMRRISSRKPSIARCRCSGEVPM